MASVSNTALWMCRLSQRPTSAATRRMLSRSRRRRPKGPGSGSQRGHGM
jgi:hypothetical protein